VYSYDDTFIQRERLAKGTDHCGSAGEVYALGNLVTAGKIVAPGRPARSLTTRGSTAGREGVLIYAVDGNFNIHVGFDGVRGETNAVKHETLFHNADVRAAGELSVVDGIIVEVNDFSGSYRTAGKLDTDRRFAEAVLTAIDGASIPLHPVEREQLRKKAGRR
jgi:hypothetical protein